MKQAYKILLTLDLYSAMRSIGLKAPPSDPYITEENLFQIINDVELALLEGSLDRQISSVCGLLWTHFGKQFDLLGEYIYRTMAKIGFAPVKDMLGTSEDKRIRFSSLLAMIETATQIQRESLTVFGRKYYLTRFQKNLWGQIEKRTHIAVTAPTSAGKSFLICLNLIHGIVQRGGVSIYIVPTLTLMNQVANDLIKLAREHAQVVSIKTHLGDTIEGSMPTIYVVTQERLADHERTLKEIRKINFLVVDEVQNIERAFDAQGGETRAKLLFDVLVEMHDSYRPDKTIILGPRISEISELGRKLFGKECTPVVASASPVTNICYAISPAKSDQITITQYSELNNEHLKMTVPNTIGAVGFGKVRYEDSYYNYLRQVIGRNKSSLIFSPTAIQARNTAKQLLGMRLVAGDERIESLAQYIENTVSTNYDLASCVRKGVAYHHGKIPHHVRNALELAIVQGKIPLVACTTTLMQGVNIPAKNVILRNPNLFVQRRKGQTPKLSGYEIANLRGRAGRLLKDFVGRTFILDGTSFEEESEQQSLFEPPSKELDGSYAEVFQRNRSDIVTSLIGQIGAKGTLAKYIGNVLYTDPSGAASLLRKGIRLTDQELSAIKLNQRRLTVPVDVCKSHRFWDPFDLQVIQDKFNWRELPVTPFEKGAVSSLQNILIRMFRLLPEQSMHYLKTDNTESNRALMLAISAIEWAKETPLKNFLQTDYAQSSSNNTEMVISTLQNTVSFGLPALLSPVYAIHAPDSMLLAAIERGAYQPGSIAQINNNIPRETAIAVVNRAKNGGITLSTLQEVLTYLRKRKVKYWSAIQYRHLVEIEEILS